MHALDSTFLLIFFILGCKKACSSCLCKDWTLKSCLYDQTVKWPGLFLSLVSSVAIGKHMKTSMYLVFRGLLTSMGTFADQKWTLRWQVFKWPLISYFYQTLSFFTGPQERSCSGKISWVTSYYGQVSSGSKFTTQCWFILPISCMLWCKYGITSNY